MSAPTFLCVTMRTVPRLCVGRFFTASFLRFASLFFLRVSGLPCTHMKTTVTVHHSTDRPRNKGAWRGRRLQSAAPSEVQTQQSRDMWIVAQRRECNVV